MFKKISFYLNKLFFFAKARRYLSNGLYYVYDGSFYLLNEKEKPNDKNPFRRVFVFSFVKKDHIDNGRYLSKDYKYILLGKNKTLYIYKNRVKYKMLKNKYSQLKNKFIYDTPELFFINQKTIYTKTIVGEKPKNVSDYIIDYLFSCAEKGSLSNSFDEEISYVQHGDMKNSNIIISKDSVYLIDLDDIDNYPLLYDVLFYVLINFKKEASSFFESKSFTDRLKTFYKKINIQFCYTTDELLLRYLKKCKDIYLIDRNLVDYEYRIRWLNHLNKELFRLTCNFLAEDELTKRIKFKEI